MCTDASNILNLNISIQINLTCFFFAEFGYQSVLLLSIVLENLRMQNYRQL